MAMVTDASPGVDPFSDPFSVPASADEDAPTAVTALLVVQGDFRSPAGAANADEDGTAEADGAGLESDGSDHPGENPHLSRTFAALAAQTRRPNRLVVVDATPERGLRERLDAMAASDLPWSFAATDLTVVVVPAKDRRPTFAEIVDTAVEALPGPGEELVVAKRVRSRARRRQTRPRDRQEWLWLLHEDSAPAPDALRNLERVVSRSERIGIAGCKVVDADRPDTLVNVGLDLTRTGRHVGTHMEGEPDQGQHDDRHDVLAVSSAGLLVRRDVYLSLGGFEPAFDGDGDGLDLCWRTHLLGHQVVVVPDAVVHQQIHDPEAGRTLRSMGRADADRPAPRSGRTLRRHRQVALARCSWIGLPFMALWIALSSAVLALLMLVLKRPRRSLAELAQASAPLGVARILGARTRFGSRGRTRRRHLGALFISGSAAGRDAWDAMRSALTPSRPSDQDTVAPHRHSATVRALRNPGLWVVLLLSVVTAVRWRPLLAEAPLRGSGHGLTGGELLPFDTDADGIWRLWRDAWGGSGLGHAGYDHPYLVVLAPITKVVGWLPWVNEATAGATVVTWLLLAAVPAAGLSAYLAGRAVTRAGWPRAVVALAWAGLATQSVAVAEGRLGPAVGHVLAPLVLAGTFAVAKRGAGGPVTFGTVLAAAVMGAFAPGLLLGTSVAAALVLAFSPGIAARLRALAVLLLPWVIAGFGGVLRGRHDLRQLLAGPGGLSEHAAAADWQLLLLHPGGAGSFPSWWSAPILALGVLGALRSVPGRGRVQLALAVLAPLALAAALFAPRLTLTDVDSIARHPWVGVPLDLFALAVLGAALVGLGSLFEAKGSGATLGSRRIGVRAGLVTALIVVLGGALAVPALTAWQSPIRTLTPAVQAMPAVAAHQAQGPRATRMVTLTVAADGAVSYRLAGAESGLAATDLDVPRTSDQVTAQLVADLIDPQADPAQTRSRLTAAAVAFIGVNGPGDRTQLLRSLGDNDALSPMASGRELSLYRVAPQPESVPISRLTVTDAQGQRIGTVPTKASSARTTSVIPSGEQGRRLVVAQPHGWDRNATVEVNGHQLAWVSGQATPTYELPAGGGELVVQPAVAYPRLRIVQGVVLVICIFLAVPFGNARSRRRA